MDILQVSTATLEGGASRAAYRLHKGFEGTDVHSQMLVRAKSIATKSVLEDRSLLTKLSPPLDNLLLKCLGYHAKGKFSVQWFPDSIASQIKALNPDLVHLHWICNGFVRIESLAKVDRPILWTLHDMWPFTGGCHYSGECIRYQKNCGKCPILNSNQQHDLSRKVLKRKAKSWKNLDLTIVTPSKWLAKCAQGSSIFAHRRIEVIPNGIDTRIFRPIDKSFARQILNLPVGCRIILFSAGSTTEDSRKGFSLLLEALKQIESQEHTPYDLAILGEEASPDSLSWNFKTHYVGKLIDEISLAMVYSAADVFIAPSRQDNLPNTVLEALACGTPCVAFNIGGMPDMIVHQRNGYLAEPFSISSLMKGIRWIFQDRHIYQSLCEYARGKVEKEFSIQIQTRQLFKLYEELIAGFHA